MTSRLGVDPQLRHQLRHELLRNEFLRNELSRMQLHHAGNHSSSLSNKEELVDREMIAHYLGLHADSIQEISSDNDAGATTKAKEKNKVSFHVQLDHENAHLHLHNRIQKFRWQCRDDTGRKIREAFFRTDLVEQLTASIASPSTSESTSYVNLFILVQIAETHEDRRELISRGFGSCLAKIAYNSITSASRSIYKYRLYKNWYWAMNNFVFYLPEADLNPAIVCPLLLAPKTSSIFGVNRVDNETMIRHCVQTLERLLLRGSPDVRNMFLFLDKDGVYIDSLKSYYRQRVQDAFNSNACCPEPSTLVVNTSIIAALSLIFDSTKNEIGSIIPAAQMNKLRRIVFQKNNDGNNYHDDDTIAINPYLVQNEKRSRQHLSKKGCVRPGESLCMYLGMCSSDNNDIRFLGALRLAAQIQSMEFRGIEDFEPYRMSTPSAGFYANQAARCLARQCSLDDDYLLLHRQQQRERPHALFATCVLLLGTSDPDPDVCRLGKIVWNSIPTLVRRQVLWCPKLHTSFPSHQKDIVHSMLKLAARQNGDGIPIPKDILIRYVLPFACDASDHVLSFGNSSRSSSSSSRVLNGCGQEEIFSNRVSNVLI